MYDYSWLAIGHHLSIICPLVPLFVRIHTKQKVDRVDLLPGHRRTRRRPCPSPSSLAAFELSFSPPSSPPSLSRFPAACNCLVIKGENLTGALQRYVGCLNKDVIVI